MFSKNMAGKSEASESPFPIMSSKTMTEKEESSESPFPITSLPKDIIVGIIARVRRCDHPTLSLVSKQFRSIVSSPELYARRSLLGRTEHRLYVLIHDYFTWKKSWYVLRNRRLVPMASPTLPTSGSFMAAGSKIYVFGEDDCYSRTAVSIECPSHTVKTLPSMPYMLTGAASMIDGKIYVSGNCDYDGFEVSMSVFNTETQMWEPEIIEPERDIKIGPQIRSSVVMAGKIYVSDYHDSVFYHPKERTWGKDKMLDSKMWMVAEACVVDDVLYYYDESENCLRAYDPNKRCWGVVNGLDDLLAKTSGSLRGSETVSYSGKLALFFFKEAVAVSGNGIWCAEISLETRQGGEIWGKVEWCHQVLSTQEHRYAFKSLPVML